ncbi:hypothetical protein [Aurantiacibacter flavus]|uniref:Secreted protein n=1 Tax=Aurantiacibacter flavus TaxID=3145232 RepID=A0ABV0CWK0_9SPHN
MSIAKSCALALAALALTSQPALAETQGECLSEAEVSSLVIYAVPHALRGVRNRCEANLAPDGFFATEGAQFSRRYAALADANWPNALSALTRMTEAGMGAAKGGLQLDQLPPEFVRPLFDEMIAQKIGQEVAVADCRRIERTAAALAPLEPEELGQVSAVVMSLVGVDKPKICTVN